MCDLSSLTIGSYEGFTWQPSQRKAALLTAEVVHSQCAEVSEGSCSQGGLRAP